MVTTLKGRRFSLDEKTECAKKFHRQISFLLLEHEFDNLFIKQSLNTEADSFFFSLSSFVNKFIWRTTEQKKKRSNYSLSRCQSFYSARLRSIDFTSLIHGCPPAQMLFSYLLIHQESNQMCHFANAPPFVRSFSLSLACRYHHHAYRSLDAYISERRRESIVRKTLIEYKLLIDRKSLILTLSYFIHRVHLDSNVWQGEGKKE